MGLTYTQAYIWHINKYYMHIKLHIIAYEQISNTDTYTIDEKVHKAIAPF
jgi:hypothetical protein